MVPAQPASVHAGATARGATNERWLVASVVVLAMLVLVGAAALGASLSDQGSPASLPSTAASPFQAPEHATGPGGAAGGGISSGSGAAGQGAAGPGAAGAAPGSRSPAPTAPSTAGAIAPGGAPVIAALTPANGVAGQGIEIAGANFLSSSGQIVATFNGHVVPTSCPAQSTCTVTVPTLPGVNSAQVVITTSAGPSNPATFTYG